MEPRSRSMMSGKLLSHLGPIHRPKSANDSDDTDRPRQRLPVLLARGRRRPAGPEELLRPVPTLSPSPNRVIAILDAAGNPVSYRLPRHNNAPTDAAAAAAASAADSRDDDSTAAAAAAAASWQQQALRALAAEALFAGLRPAALQVSRGRPNRRLPRPEQPDRSASLPWALAARFPVGKRSRTYRTRSTRTRAEGPAVAVQGR